MTTHQVVQRVLPLLERISNRTLDKARLLQYLSARAAEDWGILTYVDEERQGDTRVLLFRDRASHELRRIHYPHCLPPDLENDLLAEYKRLALNSRLTSMAPHLFAHFFRAGYCASCRYDAVETRQFCRECHFSGRPINFEPRAANA